MKRKRVIVVAVVAAAVLAVGGTGIAGEVGSGED
jgi:hypothetical protein